MQEMSRDGYNIDWKDPQGYTALHRAVGEVRMDAVFYLLLMGANANVRDDKNDQSPLMYSEGWHGPRSAVMRSYLILGGADPFAVNAEGWSEIGWTAKKGNLNGFRLLRMLGADPAAKTQKGTLYQIAVQEGHQPLIDELQKLGVKEKEVLNDDPEWLLLNAVRRGNVDQMEKLLDGGISPNLVQKKGNSLLMEAISHQQFSVSRRLMERGADLNYQNPNTGMTPLFCTIGYSDPLNADFRKEIIQKGAKVNVADKSGCTPLMKAVWFSKWHTRLSPLFIQLVDAGANLSAQDNQGVSVLNLAISEGSPAVVNYLKSKGAH